MSRFSRGGAAVSAAALAAVFALAPAAPSRAQNGAPRGPVSEAVARVVRHEAPRPRLTVVVSIDQFRADYLTRYGDLFLPAQQGGRPGGFQYLMKNGAYFANARYEHYPLYTGPGHAVILSGSAPYKNGIVGNDWWNVRAKQQVYCVDDARWKVVGAAEGSKAKPMGPLNMRSSTVGDELKLATAGRAKVVTLSLKDRAAILLGGHAQDASVWFDETGGRWISSTAYCKDGKLPAWAEQVNADRIPDKSFGKAWQPSLPPDVVASRTIQPRLADSETGPSGIGNRFPHNVAAGNYKGFTLTPAANGYVLETAKRSIAAEKLGQDDVPDLLAINLATNDYVGHAFGPYSPEALDITVQTDRLLADFLGYLDKNVPGGLKNVVVVLTADHGVSPIPEDAAGAPFGLDAGRFDTGAVTKTVADALTARYGQPEGGSWFSQSEDGKRSGAFVEGYVYLEPAAVAKVIADGKAKGRREIESVACEAVNAANIPGVYGAFGRTQILEGGVADNDLMKHLSKAVHPQLSGDVLVVSEQMYLAGSSGVGYGTSHGTAYAYDTHVPVIVCGPGLLKPGVYLDRAAPSDIAPTLSLLLGVELPSGCDGQPLLSALLP
jgi:predicted AlkP superfamily pyrophosphatase or phosphodiesterase